MYKNYFKIAFRNLWKNKGLSAINVTGLAIGIATCLVIALYVSNELSYDRFNKNADRIVRVVFQGNMQGDELKEAVVMAPVASVFKKDFPEVEDAARIRHHGTPKLKYGDKVFKEDAFAFVDSNFFRVFTFSFITGDAATALNEPNTVVITKEIAKKYFGNENPLGKVISFSDGKNAACKVTAVVEDMPANAHFHFDLFASMGSLPEAGSSNWMSSNFFTYLLLRNEGDYKKLEAKLPGVVEKYIGPQMADGTGMSLEAFRKAGNNISFHLQRLTDIHLRSDIPNDLSAPGDIKYVYIFSAIAVFMLLIACINFMNLSTAGASNRSREVGIRKVLGSMKLDLVRQFLMESVIIAAIALLLSIGLVYLGLPLFNDISGQQLTLGLKARPLLIPGFLLIVVITGILAGSYPAFYLSSFKPVAVLKGKFVAGKKTIGLRSSLVVFQFFISIVLIVSTAVVYKQLSYIQNKNVGYNKDDVLIISDTWKLGKGMEAFRQQLLTDPRIAVVSGSRFLPAGPSDNNNFFITPGDQSTQMVKTLRYEVDENYISALGIQLVKGRNFSKAFGRESNNAVINETAANALGWKDNAVGQVISRTSNKGEKEHYTIVGVVKDFHFRSLHERISSLVMVMEPSSDNFIVKLKTKDVAALITFLQKQWDKFGPEDPLNYSFLDDRYNNTYKAEQKVGLIMGVFAGLTIFVACLGLFGLAKFATVQRTKEIGVRKVLGASAGSIVALLSKDFLKLVVIAAVIASPIAWYVMNEWLKNFAYRTNISWVVFAITIAAAVSIALITISFQAIKAAIMNPVKSLRTE